MPLIRLGGSTFWKHYYYYYSVSSPVLSGLIPTLKIRIYKTDICHFFCIILILAVMWGTNVNCMWLKIKYSGKYLDVRRLRQVSNLGPYVTRNVVVYAGSLILLWRWNIDWNAQIHYSAAFVCVWNLVYQPKKINNLLGNGTEEKLWCKIVQHRTERECVQREAL
jgi:hypothetical protein